MSFKTKNNIFLAVLYIVISFAASMAITCNYSAKKGKKGFLKFVQ